MMIAIMRRLSHLWMAKAFNNHAMDYQIHLGHWNHELDPLTPFLEPRLIGFGDTVLLSSWLPRLMLLFPNDPKQTAFG